MSKATVLSTVGVISAGSSVIGAYMLGAFGDAAYLAKDLKEFEESWGGTCAKRLFSGLEIKGVSGSAGKVDSTSFNDGQGADSCLIVNWERDNYTVNGGEKWMGSFRWSWSFKKGNKGFVMFALAEAKGSGTEQKLDLTGGFYYVGKGDGNDLWSVEKYYELESSENKKISGGDFSTNFPSIGTGLEVVGGGGLSSQYPNWGFVSDSSELSKLCQGDDKCLEKPLKKSDWFRGYWTWESDKSVSSTSRVLSDWSGNFNDAGWLYNMYSKSDKLDLSNVFTTIKGKWEQVSLNTSVKKKGS